MLSLLQSTAGFAGDGNSMNLKVKQVCTPYRLVGGYDWLSKTQILYLRVSAAHCEAICFNITTKKETCMTNLSVVLNRSGIGRSGWMDWSLAPDKTKMLVASNQGTNKVYFVVDVKEGSLLHAPTLFFGIHFAWKSDSSGWIETVQAKAGTAVRLFQVSDLGNLREFTISSTTGDPLGFDKHGSLICISSPKAPTVNVSELQLSASTNEYAVLQSKPVSFPAHVVVQSSILCAEKNIIAWLVKAQDEADETSHLWISDIDGHTTKEMGILVIEDAGWIRYNAGLGVFSVFSNNSIYLLQNSDKK